MQAAVFHTRRTVLANLLIQSLNTASKVAHYFQPVSPPVVTPLPKHPQHPEDFRPLDNACFQNPYRFYQMLRDDYPLYRLSNGIYCVSRYQDIVDLSRDVDTYSSTHQGVIANLRPGQNLLREIRRFDRMAALGIIPADVLATSDPPLHTRERKVGHSCLNNHFVKTLETEVQTLCDQLLAPHLIKGEMEFMQEFAWRLPMHLILRLLGLPEQDFEQIKTWCVRILDSQNGIQRSSELLQSYRDALAFLQYCWKHLLAAKRNPQDNLLGILAGATLDTADPLPDAKAASTIFQLLIAGSDSSATTMGNALKLLIEHPDLQHALQQDETLIPAFIEEVLRLESAFQGHFRWTKQASELHGQHLPAGSRIFLLWASGNRDERVWEQPDHILLNRKNGKKHLTFGHGIHACLGRELARMEIRIVLQTFLRRTRNLRITGATPFVASMFARTLLQLPIRFETRQ